MTIRVLSHPTDATLSVTKAARLLGVHPNTVRAWSDAGRLRYYRINPRGDRRYRLGDLQRFLASAESQTSEPSGSFRRPRGPIDPRTDAEARPIAPDPVAVERHRRDLGLLDRIARDALGTRDLDSELTRIVRLVCDAADRSLVVAWELRDDRLVARAVVVAPGVTAPSLVDRPSSGGVLGRALSLVPAGPDATDDIGAQVAIGAVGESIAPIQAHDDRPTAAPAGEVAVAIPGLGRPWGVLSITSAADEPLGPSDRDLAAVVASAIGAIARVIKREEEVAHLLHRAEALRRVASDIGSRLDLDRILSGLVDHAMVLFEGDRAAVFLRRPDGKTLAEVSRGLSPGYLAAVRDLPARSLSATAIAARRPLYSVGYRDDQRGADDRSAVVQEGFDTLCTAPLMDGTSVLGLLNVYHDQPRTWSADELESIAALGTQASVAIRTAQDFQQMSTWTAQLQSIQQLGARLNHLSNVHDIGHAIATELHQLIDYHNVRVYRMTGTELLPVAMEGQVGEYVDETPEQLRVRVGEGITGWVAEHRVAQYLPDAGADPRATTIPGTVDDLDESMLLAPMVFEENVLGVVVLSKLGLDQFGDDDLRLLVIYASFAAQAMANADATSRLREQSVALEQQLRSQRELLQITESILTTLDAPAVLDGITERLSGIIACDNIAIEVVDPLSGVLTPLTARGIHAAHYLEPWELGETGVATWAVEHNEPVYIEDEGNDPRVNHFRADDTYEGSLIVVPLRGRAGAIGVLTIERLGQGNLFSPEEFDLVKLFAGQVSIALQNAEVFRAVEIRARTDALTGLLNHGTFEEFLERSVRDGSPFGLIMLDLDDFRLVNNGLGHQAGDEALRRIADALARTARDSDLLFRYGGDEFAFILPHTDAAGSMHLAERAALAVKGLVGSVTTSVGVATFPDDGSTASDVLLAADRACFVAKRNGGDRFATGSEGAELAAEFHRQAPTPVDSETTAA